MMERSLVRFTAFLGLFCVAVMALYLRFLVSPVLEKLFYQGFFFVSLLGAVLLLYDFTEKRSEVN